MKRGENHYFSWLIAYIDGSQIGKVEKELSRYKEYAEIVAFIPTVKVLKKTFKGKQTFEEIPLLFNYGFFKIPRKFAVHAKFLDDLKDNISCIYAWVKDPQKVIKKKQNLRLDQKAFYTENEIPVATAGSKEIARLVKDSFNYSAHSAEDLEKIKPGSIITLHGYPFEGVTATVVMIDPKKQSVKVKITIFDQLREMTVAYDNVFFTIYHNSNYDDSISIKNSLNATVEAGALDKKTHKDYTHEIK